MSSKAGLSENNLLFDATVDISSSIWCEELSHFQVSLDNDVQSTTQDRLDLVEKLHTAHYRYNIIT